MQTHSCTSCCTIVGRADALKLDRCPYQERLERLGITDPVLLDRLTGFRKMRNDLVHEKAIEVSEIGNEPLNTAQNAADRGIYLMKELRDLARYRETLIPC